MPLYLVVVLSFLFVVVCCGFCIECWLYLFGVGCCGLGVVVVCFAVLDGFGVWYKVSCWCLGWL